MIYNVRKVNSDKFGFWKHESSSVPELNTSATFSDRLSVVLRSMDELNQHNLEVLHQGKPGSSTMDVFVGERTSLDNENTTVGTIPRAVIELSVDKIKDKDAQVFGYVNNLDHKWPESYQGLCLGIVCALTATESLVDIHALYTVLDPSTHTKRLARIELFKGCWKVDSVCRILAAIVCICGFRLTTLYCPLQENGRRLTDTDFRGNVCIADNFVYKVFDRRIEDQLHYRRAEPSVLNIPKCELLVNTRQLQIIRYPYINGTHEPSHSFQFVHLLRALLELHQKGQVHGDVRLSNILFTKHTTCTIIDFDLQGGHNHSYYPANYNTNVGDALRHPDACARNLMMTDHDLYAVLSIMDAFIPCDEYRLSDWNEAKTFVRQDPKQAISLLNKNNMRIKRGKPSQMQQGLYTGTGSPPQLQKEQMHACPNLRPRIAACLEIDRLATGKQSCIAQFLVFCCFIKYTDFRIDEPYGGALKELHYKNEDQREPQERHHCN